MRDGRRGFTLIELMFTAGLLVVAFSGLVSAYISVGEMAETTKNYNLALGAVQQELEALRNSPLSASVPVYYFNIPGNISGSLKNRGRVTIDASNETFYRVDVDMCWEQGHARIIGPCVDQGGILEFTSPNVNGDSTAPVQVTTYMAQR